MSVGSDKSIDQVDMSPDSSPSTTAVSHSGKRNSSTYHNSHQHLNNNVHIHPPPSINNNSLKKPPSSSHGGNKKQHEVGGTPLRATGNTGLKKGGSSSSSSGGSCSSASGCIDDYNTSLESDHGRSVSFSSDKFPPPALVHARIHHGAESGLPPFSPSSFSVPPPSHLVMTSPESGNGSSSCESNTSSTQRHDLTSPITTTSDKRNGAATTAKPGSLPRLSSGEICDVPTPSPIQNRQFQPVRFNFNSSSQHLQAAAAAAVASDSVFH